MPDAALLLYGVTGYVGRLTALALRDAGLPVEVAGRRAGATAAVAAELGLPHRVFDLADPAAVDAALAGRRAVLNCAGPFRSTVRPMLEACLRGGVHYLDLAGEVDEFRTVEAFAGRAAAAGVMLLPGVGFGVAPTDCLAAHVAARVPPATRLTLAYQPVGGISRGTLSTLLADLHRPGYRRVDDRLVPTAAAARRLRVDFTDGRGKPTLVVTNPWRADLVSARYSTGIGTIDTLVAAPAALRLLMGRPRLVGSAVGGRLLRAAARRLPVGPDERQLAAGHTHVWAEAVAADGRRAASLLHGPEAYVFTAATAALLAGAVLDGRAAPGYQTPATVGGADLVLKVDGVSRVDL